MGRSYSGQGAASFRELMQLGENEVKSNNARDG